MSSSGLFFGPFSLLATLRFLLRWRRLSASTMLGGGVLTPVFLSVLLGISTTAKAGTPNPGCTIGVDNVSVIAAASFSSVQQTTMPSSVQQTATISAQCSNNAALPVGTYRWVMQIKDIQDQVIQGTTNKSVIDALGKAFTLTKLTLETNNGPPGYTPQYMDSAAATLVVSKLTSKIGVGQYLFIQHISVQRQICTWTGSKLNCANDGGQKTFAANFTLNVVAQLPPTTPPQTPSEPPPAHKGAMPNPWTVRGYAAKQIYRRCVPCGQ